MNETLIIPSLAGIRRDGTVVDSDYFQDGNWVRFNRGRPKKMGGYIEASATTSGPSRAIHVWTHQFSNFIFNFSGNGVEYLSVDHNGVGGFATDITPAGFTANANLLWSVDTLYDAAVGSTKTLILALPTSTINNIDDNTTSSLYYAPANAPTQFVAVADMNGVASGGVFCNSPYTVLYGTDGLVTWSNENEPRNFTTGDAGSARVTGAKIVKGLPLRTGSGPGGILWALDSVIRMDWIGGTQIFRFSPLTSDSSILSQNGFIEYDSQYYWVGIDRFMVSNGAQVNELPNQMNINWFFDNLNYDQRQKVWAMKVPRWGEIWWFFPFGTATECTHAVIYNVREQTWYDAACPRSAGYHAQVFRFPVMAQNTASSNVLLTLSIAAGSVSVPDQIRGVSSGATASLLSTDYVALSTNTFSFITGEGFIDITSGATGTITAVKNLYSVFTHENGTDAVVNGNVSAIDSWFETCDFGLPTGGPQPNAQQGENAWTRMTRVEPDFVQSGDMTVNVVGREFAQSDDVVSQPYTFSPTTGKVDIREQMREIRLRFRSNVQGGDYEGGKTILVPEPGDLRS